MIKVGTTTKRVILGISVPIVLFVIMYIFASVYYSGHFYPGTWINGIDCSNMAVSDALAELEANRDKYTFRIMEREGRSEVLTKEDIGYEATFEKVWEVKNSQGMWTWFLYLADISFYTVDADITFDEDKLKDAIQTLEAVSGDDIKQPENAYVDESEGLLIVPEVEGTVIDEDKLYDVLAEAVLSGKYRIDIDQAGCYVDPEITLETASFMNMTKEIQTALATTIKLHIGGDVYETIDNSVSYKWLYRIVEEPDEGVDDAAVADSSAQSGDPAGEGDAEGTDDAAKEADEVIHVGVDTEKLRAYMNEIEEKHETWGKDREFKTSYGSTVTVYGGRYGWSIDAKKETELIAEELLTGEAIEREVNNDAEAALWGEDEVGDTYIEISIDNQTMWFYKNGELLVETPIVTGCVAQGHGTPRGAYQLNNKAVNQTLTSVNPDDPYESFVNFWLPFIDNSYGIHDASWRYYYGGSIYYYNGSHGCVNTPYNSVRTIYNNIEVGTPVIIY